MSNPPSHCLECNAPLSAAETHGLCARCLLKLGFASQFGEPSVSAAGRRVPVPPPLLPFEFGGYRVLRLLGRGGMGAVYEAEQLETGRRVALKVLGQSIDSAEARKRFLREGRLAAAVSHPNSVYIYGTEEIDGAPVIAMELATGGTLRDLIKKGPLPPREAVDVILQVIAGLQTAHAAGVLHRDVKPANCFVTPDGTVKVGDFGLSVSTLARSDSQLTASGVMLGTPSYAPPEQLRADELDVRADIYSVGATLYALLTGRAPFEGDNAVQVVAAVLDKQPAPISNFRSDVPAALVQVVNQCLEKKPDNRFPNYAVLCEALLPFSTTAPEPAPLGLRFIAGVIDETLTVLPYVTYGMLFGSDLASAWLQSRDLHTLWYLLLYLGGRIGYYGISEGLWGAGLGKLLCGLRVVRPGLGAPGIARATARAILLSLSEAIGYAAQALITNAATSQARFAAGQWMLSDWTWILFVLFFVTMRRSNGFAAVHDLVTGTRVIVKARSLARPRLDVPPMTRPSESSEHIGAYIVCGSLPAKGWSIGYDELLRRPVWIKQVTPNVLPISEARRALSRPGRIRWLGGTRTVERGLDTYEAPPGRLLTQLAPCSQSWSAVRHWLADLAQEIDAASHDGTLPENLTLDYVWLTSDGRAVLLDEPLAGQSGDQSSVYSVNDVPGLQKFLDAVAMYATDRRPLPLHARDFLQRLANGAFDRATFIAGNLQSLITRPTEVTRRRRVASLILAPAICLIASTAMAIGIFRVWKGGEMVFRADNPAQGQMLDAVRLYAQASGTNLDSMEWIGPENVRNQPFADSIGKWVVYRFGDFIRDGKFDTTARTLTKEERELAKTIVKKYPKVSEEEFAGLNPIVTSAVNQLNQGTRVAILFMGPAMFGWLLAFVAIVNLVSVPAFGTSPGLRLFGLSVVDHTGNPASRLRHFLRNLLAYSVLVGGIVFLVFAQISHDSVLGVVAATGIAIVGCILSALFFISVLIWPDRSWYDRIAGTHVVLR
jgi:uncharacterized RDD family membrane protein YckC